MLWRNLLTGIKIKNQGENEYPICPKAIAVTRVDGNTKTKEVNISIAVAVNNLDKNTSAGFTGKVARMFLSFEKYITCKYVEIPKNNVITCEITNNEDNKSLVASIFSVVTIKAYKPASNDPIGIKNTTPKAIIVPMNFFLSFLLAKRGIR